MNKRELLARTIDALGLSRVLGGVVRWQGLLVFNYHRIGSPDQSFDPEVWSATPEQFDAQVRFLSENYPVVGVSDLAAVKNDPEQQRVMITFDDGYRDNFELAFPILQRHGVRATFFLTSGYLDRPQLSWWDRLSCLLRNSPISEIPYSRWMGAPISCVNGHRSDAVRRVLKTYKNLPAHELESFVNFLEFVAGDVKYPSVENLWLTWDQVRAMADGGMDIGAHTVNHPVLANCPRDVQEWEIRESKARIETEIGRPVQAFSYPIGTRNAFDDVTRECVQAAGFDWAFSFCGGDTSWQGTDPFDIPRVPVELNVSLPRFRAMTSLPSVFLA